ncbi:hypothetical protein [Iodobacter sp.]|uniref:hypothetical protein n=1 Tax=Iodobacter sp. TaxID=1915058 RepID=UPI0025F6DDEB|nr:hypothetical protein [Iodobacter sp.]
MSTSKIANIKMHHNDVIQMMLIIDNQIHSNKENISSFESFETNCIVNIDIYKNNLVVLERIKSNLFDSLYV